MIQVSRKYALNSRNLRGMLLIPVMEVTSLMCDMITTAGAGTLSQAGGGVCTPILISTDKDMYLLDPYYWVYGASSYGWGGASPGDLCRPPDGYSRTVATTVLLMDHKGYQASSDDVQYEVENATTIVASGDLVDRGDGLYTASFEITYVDSGGINFDGRDLEYFTIYVVANASGRIIDGTKSFKVGRWGYDRCHIGYTGWGEHGNPTAKQLYSWSGFPKGGPGGLHNWENILGGNGEDKTMFDILYDILYLTNSELTHTPSDYLDASPWHEMTKQKQGGNPKCSPGHRGSERLRYAYSTLKHAEIEYAKAEVVECTFCHGIGGGYNKTYWADDVTPNPNVHRLSSPHCTDCHSTCSTHADASLQNPPKDYTRVPAISPMLEDSIRLVMNTATGNPLNYHECLICHTGVDFSIYYDDDLFEITITDYEGVHKWSSMPSCTKCHSLDDAITSPGPRAYEHERLDIDQGNNTQCMRCHNIYNRTAGRYHGNNVTIESCAGCHYNFAAMNDYGTPEMRLRKRAWAISTPVATTPNITHQNHEH